MKIKVLKTTKAASCSAGISVKLYEEGQIYKIHNELGQVFINQGWGVEDKPIEEKAIEKTEIENKAVEKAPENKSFKVAKKSTTKKKVSKK